MPSYFNNTAGTITLDGVILPPRQTVVSEKHIKAALPTGITKTSDAPYYNFLLLDEVYTTDTDISLSEAFTKAQLMSVRVRAKSGNVKVYLDSTANEPGFAVLEGETEEFQINPWNASKLLVRFISPSGGENCQIKIFKR